MNPDQEKTKIKNMASKVNSQTEAAKSDTKSAQGESKDYLAKGGILLGLVGVGAGLSSFMRSGSSAQETVQLHPNTPVVPTVKDEMPFGEAFAHARDVDGAGAIFNWHGKSYAAWTKEEWDDKSDDEQNGYLRDKVVPTDEPPVDEPLIDEPPVDEPPYIGDDPIKDEMQQDTKNHEEVIWGDNPPSEVTSEGEVVRVEETEPYPTDLVDGAGNPMYDQPEEPASSSDSSLNSDTATEDQTIY